MAYASARSNPDRLLRLRPGPALGRSDRGDTSGGRDLVSAWREALARSIPSHCDDPFRHSGKARRQNRRLDGAGERGAISRIKLELNLRLVFRSSAETDKPGAAATADLPINSRRFIGSLSLTEGSRSFPRVAGAPLSRSRKHGEFIPGEGQTSGLLSSPAAPGCNRPRAPHR